MEGILTLNQGEIGTRYLHSVHPPPPGLGGGGGGGGVSNQIFIKGVLDRTSTFRGGLLRKMGCTFHTKK